MVNQQKHVQQETANSAVVVNDHNYYVSLLYIIFPVSMTLFIQKQYRGWGYI